MNSFFQLLFSREQEDPESAETRYYLRVTTVVLIALIAGAALELLPAEPSPWRWLPLGIAYLIGGGRIARDSWETLRDEHKLSIDFLMGTAAVGAAVVGSPLEGAILIFLFSLSNTLEHFAMGRTRQALSKLLDLRPQEAMVVGAEGEELGRVPVEELKPGQMILVRPGERIAADGEVHFGRSGVDQAAITGESVPVTKDVGDEVYAGTINQGGALIVTVTRDAGETMLAKIIRLVEEAREKRAPAQHFVDRFAHPYTLLVLGVTVLVAVVTPLFFGRPWGEAFYQAMTLLVVASPCALVISTPSAILSGIANGARNGILFKGGAHLDLAGTIDTVAFDKTGTLTRGRPRLVNILTRQQIGEAGGSPSPAGEDATRSHAPSPTSAEDEVEVIAVAAAVENTSEHHTARAILEAAKERGIAGTRATDFVAVAGEGVSATVDGHTAWVGNEKMADRMGTEIPPIARGWIAEQASAGYSVVYVGHGGQVIGALALGDTLKPNAVASIRHLKYEGVRWITILSGDHPQAVAAVTAGLAVDEVRAGLLPDEKVQVIRELTKSSRGVAMVGDGVNDAPAMAAATLGIAMGAIGTDVAIETADVVLMSDDVEKIDYVIHLGRRARRVVRQKVWFSVGWMFFLVILSLVVGIRLTLAVVAHEGSTLLVAANGLRLLRGKPHAPDVPADWQAKGHPHR
ncbi:MAG: heavy metal translocating P-type ATPase [Gemmatimonadota bacterium]|jgi:Cd2+/Zn2+-exporting ATPase|nr:heavy metal translocating P-type ATPase [Gemmatimonadota bacterium]